MNNYAKSISDVPEYLLKILYGLRLYEDVEVPYEKYIKRYNLISINNTAYYSSECEEWRLKELLTTHPTSSKAIALSDAVIDGCYVRKNRFGHNSFL